MVNEQLLEQSADWLDSFDELTAQEHRELRAWLKQDRAHQQAFQQVAKMLAMVELDVALLLEGAVVQQQSKLGAVSVSCNQTKHDSSANVIVVDFTEMKSTEAKADLTVSNSLASDIGVDEASGLAVLAQHTGVNKTPEKSSIEKLYHRSWWRFPHIAIAASVALFAGILVNLQIINAPTEMVNNQQPKVTLPTSLPSQALSLVTHVAETKSQRLTDGSVIHLNGMTHAEVKHIADKREVNLVAGQAYFDVARDELRPFIVNTEQAKITVLGTEFDVERLAKQLIVRVFEGQVLVSADKDVNLTVGDSVIIEAGKVLTVKHAKQRQLLPSWRTDWLEVEQLPLEQVIEKFQRYSAKTIVLATDVEQALPVSGRFKLSQPSQSLSLLSQALDLSVDETAEQLRIFRN